MVMVFINMLLELLMKDNGRMIYKMVLELKFGRMVPNMKDFIYKEKNMEKVKYININFFQENMFGMILATMKEIGLKIKLVDLEFIFGQMEENMKVLDRMNKYIAR